VQTGISEGQLTVMA